MKYSVLLGIGLFLSFQNLYALNGYNSKQKCGTARIVSGDTCENIVVELDFAGCELKSSPMQAKKVICEGALLKARLEHEDYRFEARFYQENSNAWGGGSGKWISAGAMKQWKKIGSQAAAKVESAPEQVEKTKVESKEATVSNQTAEPQAQSTAQTSVATLKFSGFADFRYTNFSSKDNMTVPNAHAESGFGLEDGAFYINYEKEKVAILIDVAFRRSKDSDTNSAAPIPNQSSNGNFAIGVDKSQLYLRYKASDNYYINFGQFDTIYGVELNDSKDRVFGKTGLVYDATLPVTHAGALLEYNSNGMVAKVFAANPNNKGSYGTSANSDDNTEYGASVGYSNENFRFQLGLMSRQITKADASALGSRTLSDLTAGMTFGFFSLDAEYAIVNDPSKNTLTPGDNTDSENAGTGLLVMPTFKVTDAVLLGLRYEHLQDDPTAGSIESVDAYGFAAHYRLSSDLQLRAEYVGYNYKNLANVKWGDQRLNAAALLTF